MSTDDAWLTVAGLPYHVFLPLRRRLWSRVPTSPVVSCSNVACKRWGRPGCLCSSLLHFPALHVVLLCDAPAVLCPVTFRVHLANRANTHEACGLHASRTRAAAAAATAAAATAPSEATVGIGTCCICTSYSWAAGALGTRSTGHSAPRCILACLPRTFYRRNCTAHNHGQSWSIFARTPTKLSKCQGNVHLIITHPFSRQDRDWRVLAWSQHIIDRHHTIACRGACLSTSYSCSLWRPL